MWASTTVVSLVTWMRCTIRFLCPCAQSHLNPTDDSIVDSIADRLGVQSDVSMGGQFT